MKKIILRLILFIFIVILIAGIYIGSKLYTRLYPSPTIKDSATTFIGFNHIGITVLDLDEMLDFYTRATGYPVSQRITIKENEAADELYGKTGIAFERAILKGPNMLLELTEFHNQTDTVITKMTPQGPGMTHTCYQSPEWESGYEKFKNIGVEMISRGDQPIDLGGYGVTYAYARDPEGNMLELEQMSQTLINLQIGKEFAENNSLWMTQVALISTDLPPLTAYYETVLGIEPYRVISVPNNPRFDEITNIDGVAFDSSWFRLDSQGKKMELMQFTHPLPTHQDAPPKRSTDLGYTFSFEVTDIQEEYKRLTDLGIEFISEPRVLGGFWEVFAVDVDGNIYSLRQATEPNSIYSLLNFSG